MLKLIGHAQPWPAMTGHFRMGSHDQPWQAMSSHIWPWPAMSRYGCRFFWPVMARCGQAKCSHCRPNCEMWLDYGWSWPVMAGHGRAKSGHDQPCPDMIASNPAMPSHDQPNPAMTGYGRSWPSESICGTSQERWLLEEWPQISFGYVLPKLFG